MDCHGKNDARLEKQRKWKKKKINGNDSITSILSKYIRRRRISKKKKEYHDYDQQLKNDNRNLLDIVWFRRADMDILEQAYFVFFNHIGMNVQNNHLYQELDCDDNNDGLYDCTFLNDKNHFHNNDGKFDVVIFVVPFAKEIVNLF